MVTAGPRQPDVIDSAAEDAVRILALERLFQTPATAERIFAQIAKCDDFVEKERPPDPDATFTRMALELAQELILYASDRNGLDHARHWVSVNGLLLDGDAMSVLSVLTLIHITNAAVKRYPRDRKWARMKKRVEKLRPVRRAA